MNDSVGDGFRQGKGANLPLWFGADTADCRFRDRDVVDDVEDIGGSLPDTGLDACELDDVLFVELQLLGLRECDRLDAALPPFPRSTI